MEQNVFNNAIVTNMLIQLPTLAHNVIVFA